MNKVLTIAAREYGAMVGTKAFLLSITLMPVLMFGGIIVAGRFKDVQDVDDSKLVIVDGSGGLLFDQLRQAAEARNAAIGASPEGEQLEPRYVLERFDSDSLTDEDRFELSEQVRGEQIKAFAEIPYDILTAEKMPGEQIVGFFAQNAMIANERRWLESNINDFVAAHRLTALDIDPAVVKRATAFIDVEPMGLVKRTSDGGVSGAEEGGAVVSLLLPFGFLMLMFMVIMMSAQPMLESVLEEKGARIAEVILSSASPFQIMFGKLLGNVAGSLSVVLIYGAGGYAVAVYKGWTDMIPGDLVGWFLVYQILAVLLFSSVFMAVGSAVSQLKEAQSLLLPVWLLMCIPMFVWMPIVREPNGDIATALSFFPPAIPLVMVLRLGSEAVVPLWQILAGLVVLVATTLCVVFVAGRIFRVGILWQGKTPRMGEIARWALRG